MTTGIVPSDLHLQMLDHVHLSTLLKLCHEFLHRAIAGRHGGLAVVVSWESYKFCRESTRRPLKCQAVKPNGVGHHNFVTKII